ncbi:hypothetical protein ACJX0J_004754 (mitochondrion) [Zea mays]
MYVSYFIVFPMHGKQLPNGVLYFTQVLAHFPLLFLFYQEIFALCSYARMDDPMGMYEEDYIGHFMHFTFGYSTWGLFQTCPAKALHPVMEASDFRFLYSQMEITVVRARQAKQ